MSETKDVEVHVTGVSMSGAVKDDNKRSASTDQKKSGQKNCNRQFDENRKTKNSHDRKNLL